MYYHWNKLIRSGKSPVRAGFIVINIINIIDENIELLEDYMAETAGRIALLHSLRRSHLSGGSLPGGGALSNSLDGLNRLVKGPNMFLVPGSYKVEEFNPLG